MSRHHPKTAAAQAELLDSPINASFIRSFNIGQNDPDAKESTRISISGAKVQRKT